MRVQSQSRSVLVVVVGKSSCAKGFTLIELMITIAVAVVLLMIAVPSFTNLINTNRLNTAANALIGALNTARMAAIQQNTSAQFCSNAASSNTSSILGTACGTNAGTVFVLTTTADTPPTFVATQLAAAPAELDAPSLEIHGSIQAISFNSQGQGLVPGTTLPPSSTAPIIDICSTALSASANNHVQIYMAAGSVITTHTSSGACP